MGSGSHTLSDLVISNFSISTGGFSHIVANVTIKNQGNADASNFAVSLYNSNSSITATYGGRQVIKELKANESCNAIFIIPVQLGALTLNVKADSDNTVSESNEKNNVAIKSGTIYKPQTTDYLFFFEQPVSASSALQPDMLGDFRNDGIEDLVILDETTGDIFVFENNEADKRFAGNLNITRWEIAAIGDCDLDGRDDLILRDTVTDALSYWASADSGKWNTLAAETNLSQFKVIA